MFELTSNGQEIREENVTRSSADHDEIPVLFDDHMVEDMRRLLIEPEGKTNRGKSSSNE